MSTGAIQTQADCRWWNSRMYADQPYMIPVNPNAEDKKEKKIVVGKQVTPVAALLERVKSEYKRQVEEGHPVVPLNQAEVEEEEEEQEEEEQEEEIYNKLVLLDVTI
ncbi:hypothetical protein KUTeg_017987 [Tegillarca granosa]|uniref:Uncharacterized protein n=1 Tax=Tegillarca granosa TaxID=220873 RepID=A0ABQ9EGJ0_TEGGR|nr:hypothetical protein KUTeg_017987 [Tegillarca granosa]